jgi:hypothetical protein
MKRRYSREYALEVLYANELNPQTEKINSEIYKKLSDSGKQFAESLINSVRENNEEIDLLIKKYIKKWSINQLNVVDKNILRIAIAEMLFLKDEKQEKNVIFNEAIEIAKIYGGKNSFKFINGILESVSGDING